MPVTSPARFSIYLQLKPNGLIRCSLLPVTAQVLTIFPYFVYSGSTNTTFKATPVILIDQGLYYTFPLLKRDIVAHPHFIIDNYRLLKSLPTSSG